MKSPLKAIAPVLALALAACQESPRVGERALIDPISGASHPTRVTELEGWSVIQVPGKPESYLMLAQTGRPVLTVMDLKAGRVVFVEQQRTGSDTIELLLSHENRIEHIKFFSDGAFHIIRRSATGWEMASHPMPEESKP